MPTCATSQMSCASSKVWFCGRRRSHCRASSTSAQLIYSCSSFITLSCRTPVGSGFSLNMQYHQVCLARLMSLISLMIYFCSTLYMFSQCLKLQAGHSHGQPFILSIAVFLAGPHSSAAMSQVSVSPLDMLFSAETTKMSSKWMMVQLGEQLCSSLQSQNQMPISQGSPSGLKMFLRDDRSWRTFFSQFISLRGSPIF